MPDTEKEVKINFQAGTSAKLDVKVNSLGGWVGVTHPKGAKPDLMTRAILLTPQQMRDLRDRLNEALDQIQFII